MKDMGQVSPGEVLDRVSRCERVWVRLAAIRSNARWDLALLEMSAPAAPRSWSQGTWEYDEAFLTAVEVAGPVATTWLRGGKIVIETAEIELAGFDLGQPMQWERHASGERSGGFEPTTWPHTAYHLANHASTSHPNGPLVSAESPSFFNFASAVNSLLGLPERPGGGLPQTPMFIDQDLSGRIAGVEVSLAEVAVAVEGDALEGAIVELASISPGPTERLSAASERAVRFETPDGLLPSSWVVLKKGDRWLDRRFLNWPYQQSPSADVKYTVEPASEVHGLILGGEGPTTEFKSIVPEKRDDRRKVCRTIAAFANGDGGHVIFGVGNDGEVLGLPDADTDTAGLDTVTRFIKDTVTPLPEFAVSAVAVDVYLGRTVIHVVVEQGATPPYGVGPENPQYYVRRGATTFPLPSDGVRALARSRPTAPLLPGDVPIPWAMPGA